MFPHRFRNFRSTPPQAATHLVGSIPRRQGTAAEVVREQVSPSSEPSELAAYLVRRRGRRELRWVCHEHPKQQQQQPMDGMASLLVLQLAQGHHIRFGAVCRSQLWPRVYRVAFDPVHARVRLAVAVRDRTDPRRPRTARGVVDRHGNPGICRFDGSLWTGVVRGGPCSRRTGRAGDSGGKRAPGLQRDRGGPRRPPQLGDVHSRYRSDDPYREGDLRVAAVLVDQEGTSLDRCAQPRPREAGDGESVRQGVARVHAGGMQAGFPPGLAAGSRRAGHGVRCNGQDSDHQRRLFGEVSGERRPGAYASLDRT